MNSKKWIGSFLVMLSLFFICLVVANYIVDPFGYFRAMKGDYFEYNEEMYARDIKAEYIKKHGREYNAYLIGGSKAGAIDTKKLSEIDGYKYYNSWIISGNFREYKNYTKFIIDNTDVKK